LALLQIGLDELSRKAVESRGAQGFARFFAVERLGMNGHAKRATVGGGGCFKTFCPAALVRTMEFARVGVSGEELEVRLSLEQMQEVLKE